jgi:hypothetical protein
LIIDPNRPFLLTENLLLELNGGHFIQVLEVLPEPSFYPEKNNKHLFKLDSEEYRIQADKGNVDSGVVSLPKMSRIRSKKSSAVENNKARLKLRMFERGYKGFSNFVDYEKECNITTSSEFAVGSAATADFLINDEQFVSPFQCDIHFQTEVGWIIKPRELNTGTYVYLKNFAEFLESQVKNVSSKPQQLRKGMKIEFAGNVLKVL